MTAQRVRRLICDDFDEALSQVDVIVTPTSPMAAPTIEECHQGFVLADGKKISLRDTGVNFRSLGTAPFNVTGLPALSVCCGFTPADFHRHADCWKSLRGRNSASGSQAYEGATEWHKRAAIRSDRTRRQVHSGETAMMTKEENDLLTQTDRGTPMGELMRRYWQPVALSEELPKGVRRYL